MFREALIEVGGQALALVLLVAVVLVLHALTDPDVVAQRRANALARARRRAVAAERRALALAIREER